MASRLSSYQKDWFRFDAVAGLTTAAVVIPKAMAFATIAGLPVQAGIYVAIVPMFVYALLGTSRRLSVSSTSTLAILTATELAVVVPSGDPGQLLAAASTLALLVGAVLLLAGILRLGFLANFISDPVLTGFKAGIGMVIVVDQLPKLLGLHIEKGNFFHDAFSTLRHVPDAKPRNRNPRRRDARDSISHGAILSQNPRSPRRRDPRCSGRPILRSQEPTGSP